jgi:cell fate regulator YaaT (PSP1 superfamily)
MKPDIVGIRFKPTDEVVHLNTLGTQLKLRDKVVIRLEKGKEVGYVVSLHSSETEEIDVFNRWRIIRQVTEEDLEQIAQNEQRQKEAFAICESKIKKLRLPMKLLRVVYTFDANRITFFFKAPQKIDFRQLVRQLAAVFKTRIEMRQVGARDETELLGGIGVCGRELCCHYWSCRNVKWCRENTGSRSKLVGLCNRTLCCMKYESEELDSKHLAEMKKKKCQCKKHHNQEATELSVENIEDFEEIFEDDFDSENTSDLQTEIPIDSEKEQE